MAPLTSRQAQVVDPILTPLIQDYRPDTSMHVWPILFPIASVNLLEGKYIRHSKSGFVEVDIRRAKTGAIQRVRRGWTDESVSLERRSMAGEVAQSDAEQAANIPGAGIALQQREMTLTMDQVSLQIEIEAARVAQDTDSFASGHSTSLASGARWDKTGADPQVAVSDAKALVRRKCGREPNVLVLGYEVCRKLLLREDIKEEIYGDMPRLERTMSDADKLMRLARYFGVDHVAQCQALKVQTEDDDDFDEVWGKVAILARSELSAESDTVLHRVTWGAGLRLMGYPRALESWYDNDHTCWVHPMETYDTPVTITDNAGYLWLTAVD
ncbi:MAG: hypothetical protein F4112_16015 [Holophagales bacterium]|nr:hypothetical protein [Holophagales bacterium]MYB20854.1 hypothetical protein [Holophagales bacterium]MYD22001.1 hypothetical protein [Holophagales bacterium]MYH25494.1 hypothetical protein [Holophagales bacterium]MYI34454.1 hypothetical protein [Holophagales bacterium]